MNTENKISINNLIYALLFLTFGIILLSSTEDIISMASKVIGTVIAITGIVKTLIYVYRKGQNVEYGINELLIALLLIGFGITLIFISATLSFAIRVIIGIWVIFAGVNRVIFSLSNKPIIGREFWVYLLTAVFMVVLGGLIISGIFDAMIGLLIIIYALAEIFDYIYYTLKSKSKESVNETHLVEKKDSKKKSKKGKVVDAVIEEEKEQ